LKANGVALLKCKALGSIFGGYFISMNMIPPAKEEGSYTYFENTLTPHALP
jgi:hypothetical protein